MPRREEKEGEELEKNGILKEWKRRSASWKLLCRTEKDQSRTELDKIRGEQDWCRTEKKLRRRYCFRDKNTDSLKLNKIS